MEMDDQPRDAGKTILLADDEDIILEILQEILHRSGYNTLTAENGEQAIEVFKKHRARIDLVILDMHMPGMGGYDCLKELRIIDPEIKVIIASGYAVDRKFKEDLKSGLFSFIPKPYRRTDILRAIREALDLDP